MRIEWVALLLSGCLSASSSSDVARVRELTRVDRLPAIADVDVDPAASEDAQRMLQGAIGADDAVRIALLQNRSLRASLREMGIARGRLRQAGLLPNPLVEVELVPERDSDVELRVEYDITGLVLAPVRARASALGLQAARYDAAGAVIELGFRVRSGFYTLQASTQRLAIAQRALEAFAASRDAAQALFDAGNTRELDLARADAAYQRARVSVAEMELEVATDREAMQRLLGAHGEATEWQVRGELERVGDRAEVPDRLERRALEASLELAAERHRLEELARRAGYTRTAGWFPDIDVDVHALRTDGEEGDQREWRFGGGLSVTLPIFDRGQGNAAAIDAELEGGLERYYGTAVDLRSAAREARNRVVSTHARARLFQETILPAQARVLEQTMLQYNAMQIGVFEVLDARRAQLDAELEYVATLRDHWTAVAELRAILAGRRVMASETRSTGMPMGGASEGGH